MKRMCIVLLCAVMTWTFGCSYTYYGPTDDPNEVWVADDSSMFFCWDADNGGNIGKLCVGNDYFDIEACCTVSNWLDIYIFPYPEGGTYTTTCLMSGDLIRVSENIYSYDVSRVRDGIEIQIAKIPMTKYDISEIEWVDGWPVPIEE